MAASKITIKKVCEWCGQEFYAKKLTTRFCCKRCNEHAYKAKLRRSRVSLVEKELLEEENTKVQEHFDGKQFLTVIETAALLGMTRMTVYNIALTYSEPQGFYIALIDPQNLADKYSWNIPIEDQEGRSFYKSMNSEHKNFMVFTIDEIKNLVNQIHEQYLSTDKFVCYSRTRIVELFANEVDCGILDVEKLKHENKKKWEVAYEELKSVQKQKITR